MFLGRVLPFDLACTTDFAALLATLRKAGIVIQTADASIPFRAAGCGCCERTGGDVRVTVLEVVANL